jgi:hypothetical protein
MMGVGKVFLALLAAFLATVAAARIAFEATAPEPARPVAEPWAQDRMEFLAWNEARWTGWVRDGRFELVPEDTDRWSRHANPTLAFVGWDGERWQAKLDGDAFVLARRGNWERASERSDAIRYLDWLGRQQIRTVEQLAR